MIAQSLQSGHYSPKDYNDTFSEAVFKKYLDNLDGNKRFFLKEDYEQLKKYKTRIDDEIAASSYEFFDRALSIYQKRLKEASAYYQSILSEPLNFKLKESVELNADKRPYPEDKEAMKEVWRRFLKYQMLTKIHVALKRQEKAKKENDTTVEQQSFQELEKEARKEVKNSQEKWFDRMLKLNEKDWFSEYLNVIANTFDPHTGYFPPKDKENFDISLSGRLEGIGATLQMKNGYIEVQRIVPGSASWRQGDLQAGDVILKVAQKDEKPVDVVDMRLDNAVQLIRGEKGTDVILTVKKIDGSIEEITITRDVVVLEETYAKSAVLKSDTRDQKIGYIKIPKFYADFNNEGGRSCAEDVKKEISELKNDGIDGLIIDVRDNGGGSLRDVVDMAGLFIKNGPVVQIKPRKGAPHILRDENDNVHFSDPLIIMVNTFSASASEILAAAMQDYERGLVMGSGSTYGKGTVQRFYNLDKMLKKGFNDIKPLGSLKLTTQKFYRVNGGATQIKGVSPDILIPDKYTYLEIGEGKKENALPWDEIGNADYQKAGMVDETTYLKNQAMERIQTHDGFQTIKDYAQTLKEENQKTAYSLNVGEFRAQKERIEAKSDKYKKTFKPVDDFEIAATSHDHHEMKHDSTDQARFEQFEKNLEKDLHVFQTMQTLYDWLDNPEKVDMQEEKSIENGSSNQREKKEKNKIINK